MSTHTQHLTIHDFPRTIQAINSSKEKLGSSKTQSRACTECKDKMRVFTRGRSHRGGFRHYNQKWYPEQASEHESKVVDRWRNTNCMKICDVMKIDKTQPCRADWRALIQVRWHMLSARADAVDQPKPPLFGRINCHNACATRAREHQCSPNLPRSQSWPSCSALSCLENPATRHIRGRSRNTSTQRFVRSSASTSPRSINCTACSRWCLCTCLQHMLHTAPHLAP